MALAVREDVPLGPLTTLELGGQARYFVDAPDEATLGRAILWGTERAQPVFILGGGSNLVVVDAGFAGLVIRMQTRGVSFDGLRVTAAAGEGWDDLVAQTVARGLCGMECLSGIPGTVGAAPIQNVGAYGQDVSDTLESVRVRDRLSGEVLNLAASQCGFGYRQSLFKRVPDRYIILSATFVLHAGPPEAPRYAELTAALGHRSSVGEVRASVLELRRKKSMLFDPDDENRRSAGSFFMNPVVTRATADRVQKIALEQGLIRDPSQMPQYSGGDDQVKLAAAWLVERSGFAKGFRRGAVGLSSRHALALVHHGGGNTTALLALARDIRTKVETQFAIRLIAEPVVLGACGPDVLEG